MNEKKACEVCGNVPTEKYGSGRFCNFNCKQRFVSMKDRAERNRKISEKLSREHVDVEATCENCDTKFTCTVKVGSPPTRFCNMKCSRSFATKHSRKQISEKVSRTLSGRETWIKGRTLEKKFDLACQRCGDVFKAASKRKKWCDKHPNGRGVVPDVSSMSDEELKEFEERKKRSLKRALNAPVQMSEEKRRHLSEVMKRRVIENPDAFMGGNRGRVKTFIVDGIELQGMWEVHFYNWAKEAGLNPQRCKESFSYTWRGIRRYFPDFYLPTLDIYVEVKGFETERDRAKWESFPRKLIIIRRDEITQIAKGTFSLK